jgi:threonine dehydrogenase-like Zn-dependent dehydrogenase
VTKVMAAVMVAPRRLELTEFERPKIQPDTALLRVEVTGICGSDYSFYAHDLATTMGVAYPYIPGHEAVGVIEEIGPLAARRWGVKSGDRVAIEAAMHCGFCANCLRGELLLCDGSTKPGLGYGHVPVSVAPSLWGGYAQYMYLEPNTVLYKVPETLTAEQAVLYQPLGGGVRWASRVPKTKSGDTVAIFGAGQRGLTCVIGAKEAGAANIIVTGLTSDQGRLELAREFGASATINVEEENAVDRIKDLTDGKMADVVVDISAGATQPVVDAIYAARPGGTVVLAGLKDRKPISGFISDDLVQRQLTVIGVRAVDYESYTEAFRILASGKYPLEKMRTHEFPLADAENAVRTIGREISDGKDPICVAIKPHHFGGAIAATYDERQSDRLTPDAAVIEGRA